MGPILLVRHAAPHRDRGTAPAEWPLSDKGRDDARLLGTRVAARCTNPVVLTSPERRARETAALAFPSTPAATRDHLGEVHKPWYPSAADHAQAVADYLQGAALPGWERRDTAISRVEQLLAEVGPSEDLVLVSHGVLLTAWLDRARGLDDPFSFWSGLRTPDAWVLDLEDGSLGRVPGLVA